MPEICEVAITTHFIYKYFKNYTLTDINILGGRYIHQELKGLDNIVQSMPLKLLNVSFKGKFMWFKFENNNYILNTLGLTGYWGIDENIHNRVEFVFKKSKKIKSKRSITRYS
jgi:formamidopyrimidine-DNA glycosylase